MEFRDRRCKEREWEDDTLAVVEFVKAGYLS